MERERVGEREVLGGGGGEVVETAVVVEGGESGARHSCQTAAFEKLLGIDASSIVSDRMTPNRG
jgi:hypothetical protein